MRKQIQILLPKLEGFIDLERKYLSELKIIVECYILPLLNEQVFNTTVMGIIFSNIEEIYKIHKEIESKMNRTNIGQSLTNWGPSFSIYEQYISNHILSKLMLNKQKADERIQIILTKLHKKFWN